MKRQEFSTLVGAAAEWRLGVWGQHAQRTIHVGVNGLWADSHDCNANPDRDASLPGVPSSSAQNAVPRTGSISTAASVIRSIIACQSPAASLFDFSGIIGRVLNRAIGDGNANAFTTFGDTSRESAGPTYFGVGAMNAAAAGPEPANASIQGAGPLPSVLSGTITDGNNQFAVSIASFDGSPIDPSRTTWILIHGWDSSPADFSAMVSAIHNQRPSDQILLLDWSSAADTGELDPFDAEARIPLVANWAAPALVNAGFSGANLNEIGHSFGAYVADEIAELVPGGVNTIVGLDPALNVPGGYDSEGPSGTNFAQYSQESWAFHDSDPANLGNLDGLGSPITPVTADDAIDVANSNHSEIRDLFTYFINHPNDPVAQDFSLQRLLDHQAGPWLPNQYSSSGALSSGSGYEAVISATGGGVVPQFITYIAATSLIESFVGGSGNDPLTGDAQAVINGGGTDYMGGGRLFPPRSTMAAPTSITGLPSARW